jgi:Zn-dependent alcohol dehydrogenase
MLDEMVSDRLPFAQINEGFALLGAGHATRFVADMEES